MRKIISITVEDMSDAVAFVLKYNDGYERRHYISQEDSNTLYVDLMNEIGINLGIKIDYEECY